MIPAPMYVALAPEEQVKLARPHRGRPRPLTQAVRRAPRRIPTHRKDPR